MLIEILQVLKLDVPGLLLQALQHDSTFLILEVYSLLGLRVQGLQGLGFKGFRVYSVYRVQGL